MYKMLKMSPFSKTIKYHFFRGPHSRLINRQQHNAGGVRRIIQRGLCNVVSCQVCVNVDQSTQSAVEEDKKLLVQLYGQIKEHSHLYYNKQPKLRDDQFDALVRNFEQCCNRIESVDDSFVRPAIPVGAPPPAENGYQGQVHHSVSMLSLASYDSDVKVWDWFDRICNRGKQHNIIERDGLENDEAWCIEPKMDGLAVRLLYQNGTLVEAATRGNGTVGENVLNNIALVQGVICYVGGSQSNGAQIPQLLEVRGEIYISDEDFEVVQEERRRQGLEEYSSQRNLAAGSIRLLDRSECANRRLSFVAFQVLFDDEIDSSLSQSISDSIYCSHYARLQWLKQHSFAIHESSHLSTQTGFIGALQVGQEWLKNGYKDLHAPVDGVVLKLDNIELQKKFGDDGHDPRWAVACKFPPTSYFSTIQSFEVNVGRTGQLTPIINVSPVDIKGVTVSRASAHNVELLHNLDLGVGDVVELKRSGEVIPQVVQRVSLSSNQRWQPPSNCPNCGQPLKQNSLIIRCVNPNCGAQHSRQLEYYASLCFKGVGKSVVSKLQAAGLVDKVTDFYKLTRAQLMNLDGIQSKSSTLILKAIEDSKKLPASVVLQAVGIRYIGSSQAKHLIERFPTSKDLLNASLEDLASMEGFGKITSQAIFDWMRQTENQDLLQELWKIMKFDKKPKSKKIKKINKKSPAQKQADVPPLAGKKILVTGSVPSRTRTQVKEYLENFGAIVSSGVSKSLNILVLGESPGQQKIEKAQHLGGIQILGWDEFVAAFNLD